MMKYFTAPITKEYSVTGIATIRGENSTIGDIKISANHCVIVFSISEKRTNFKWQSMGSESQKDFDNKIDSISKGLQFALSVDERTKTVNTYIIPDNFLYTEEVVEWIVGMVSDFINTNLEDSSEPISINSILAEDPMEKHFESALELEKSIIWAEQGISIQMQKDIGSQEN